MDENEFAEIDAAINRLLGGDETARQELIQLSYGRLKKLARKMLKDFPTVKRWEETDDVFQNAAMRLWKSLEKVQPTTSRHYFNLAAMQVRRELIELSRSLKGPLGLDRNQDSVPGEAGATNANHQNVASETHEASRLAAWSDFHEKVGELEPDEQEVFALIWYQGLSQHAVGKLLEVSQKTVSRRWQKASRSVFALLGNSLPE